MNIKEAIKLINELRNSTEYMEVYSGAFNEPMNVALEIAVDSMQKQIPKKPSAKFYPDGSVESVCPNCKDVAEYELFTCCPSCGQRIDWSEE